MIYIDNVSWSVSSREAKIIDNLSLKLAEGEIYGILGANGAGKSSLLKLISRLQKPTSGHIYISDEDCDNEDKSKELNAYSRKELATKLAYMQQSFQPNVDFTVYDIVAMGREVYRKSFSGLGKRDKEIILSSMEAANCLHLADSNIRTLSGGERQRVAFAKTIAQDTQWLLLDEPIANLDIKHQLEVMKKVKELNQNNKKSVIAVLHDLNLAANNCTKLIFMKKGKVVAYGDTNEVLNENVLREVYDIEFEIILRGNRYIISPNDI